MEFSIVIPAHNSELFIWKALESVYSQIYDPNQYEIIVVCDKCNDATRDVAKIYTDKIIETNYGRDGLARQAGTDIATGDWLLFLDDDDWWLHEYVLQTLHDQIDGTFNLLLFGFVWKSMGNIDPIRIMPDGRQAYWPNVWSKMHDLNWLRKVGVRWTDQRMTSDLRFTRDEFREAPALKVLHQPLYYYNYMRIGSQTEVARNEG